MSPAVETWGQMTVELAAATLILLVAEERGGICRVLSAGPLVWIGLTSYAIYLFHHPIARAVRIEHAWPETLAIVLGASVLLASASYVLVERPMRDFRHRWKPGAEPQPA
jgi:peptidoglycan/LPS O-acetylase OafA/YrhL